PFKLPEQYERSLENMRTSEGQKVQTVRPKATPLEPSLVATLKRFPTHAVNGAEDLRKPEPSVLVPIPARGAGSAVLMGPGEVATDAPGAAIQDTGHSAPKPKPQAPTPGKGKLRSLGE
ncbi:MAG: hypothetical protein ACREIT_00950, partial [Tepidisphaeraceae bacterium]